MWRSSKLLRAIPNPSPKGISSTGGRCFRTSSFSLQPSGITTPLSTNSSDSKVDGAKAPFIAFFPWIQKGSTSRGFFRTFFNNISSMCVFNTINRGGNRGPLFLNELFVGGEAAFICAVEGIFNHNLMIIHREAIDVKTYKFEDITINEPSPPATDATTTTATASKDKIEEKQEDSDSVLELHDMFGPELKDFFTHAIENHCKHAHRKILYSLKSIERVNLVKLNAVLNVQRNPVGNTAEDIKVRKKNKTNTVLIAGLGFIIGMPPDKDSYTEAQEAFSNGLIDNPIVRVHLNVRCTGNFTFLVRYLQLWFIKRKPVLIFCRSRHYVL
jgi:hypothetical protein